MRRACAIAVALLMLGSMVALASSSSTVWTPCTIDIQPAGVTNITVSNYFGFGSNSPEDLSAVDLGAEWGAQLTPKLAMEYGLDIFSSPITTPFFLNAKIGYRENTISKNAPALQLGFFGFGTERENVDNQLNILYLIVGKSLPGGMTRLAASYYVGRPNALKSSKGEVENNGYMLAIDHQIVPGKWVLAADYASGKNLIGGGGVGVYYYFTDDISILAGPVWFNDNSLNGSTKMTVQASFDF